MRSAIVMDEESLEDLAERMERWQARDEDDEESALGELIEAFADVEREPAGVEEFVGPDQFTCRACGMILNRGQLVDVELMVCAGCARFLIAS
jgi:hypothetical protein